MGNLRFVFVHTKYGYTPSHTPSHIGKVINISGKSGSVNTTYYDLLYHVDTDQYFKQTTETYHQLHKYFVYNNKVLCDMCKFRLDSLKKAWAKIKKYLIPPPKKIYRIENNVAI